MIKAIENLQTAQNMAMEMRPKVGGFVLLRQYVDQDGKSTFPEILISIWKAGVVQYEADFLIRKVTYFGSNNETYEEEYPEIKLQKN